ncbi:chitin synthase [Phlyctochytrium arcticum]|nr:chitin synthase [Phlyctochytrium arcticum]
MVNRTLTTRTLGGTVLHHRRPYSYESTEDADENASLDITRMRRETSMRRARTMVRLDRCKTRDPLMRKRTVAAPLTRAGATTNHFNRELGERSNVPPHAALTAYTTPLPPPENDSSWWTTMSRCLTCCAVPRVLERTMGMKDRVVQQAWREKVALCIIIAMLCTIVGFLTVGLRPALCPANDGRTSSEPYLNQTDGTVNNFGYDSVVIKGGVYPFDRVREVVMGAGGNDIDDSWRGRDVSWLMNGNSGDPCSELAGVGWDVGRLKGDCRREGLGGTTGRCLEWTKVAPLLPPPRTRLFFSWSELAKSKQFPHQLLAFNGLILNLTDLNTLFPSWNTTPLGTIVHKSLGSDSSYLLLTRPDSRVLAQCLVHHFAVGYVDREGSGCAVYQTISIFLLLVVVGVVLAKFLMGVVFYWVWGEGRGGVQWRWGAVSRFSPRERALRVQLQQQEQMLHHQKMLTQQQQQMWYTNESGEMMPNTYGYPAHGPSSSYIPVTTGFPPPAAPSQEMYTLLLVTCYSESAQGIRTTLESLAETTYPDDKKLLFVIADGLIKGDDWKELGMTTPEVIVEMLTGWEEPEPKSYLAIADGERQHNMAKVYAGYFSSTGHTVPTILVVKCGTPSESSSAKPGNRGKRDSQLILMNFFSRVLFDDRMTPLDHELYNAIQRVTHGAPAESFEAVLMVDADTRVGPSSLGYMVDALVTDDQIMGLCGETRIANKRDSWVTMIQVFEYYISHHSGKAFESVFGGVTCLPGCFCMYRIKAIKPNGLVVPLLVNPDIVDEYSENVLDTLHKKNLLLLGEDRFLSTLLLRQFPKRKMVFVPRAVCHTVVPDTLAVLTSQRRRWINSTVHNLLELVKVKELCGIFCFSMQFVVALDLFSTAVLPAALLFMYVLIITAIAGQGATLPLAMLLVSLLLPAVLITLTTRKWVYVGWMGVYLLALPVWNFMLPLYAFWHFDDFSWGETRKVEGDDGGHGGTSGTFEVGSVHLKRYVLVGMMKTLNIGLIV